jgi:hypothetical protein
LWLYCYFHTSPMSLSVFSIPINMIVSRSQSSIHCSYFSQAVLSMIIEVLGNITLNWAYIRVRIPVQTLLLTC